MVDPSIDRLSFATQTKLRSTQILTSLPQIVSELFQNSLDAGAKHIEIGINCAEWSCWVTDDGSGMSRDELDQFGSEGRYRTSAVSRLSNDLNPHLMQEHPRHIVLIHWTVLLHSASGAKVSHSCFSTQSQTMRLSMKLWLLRQICAA